MRFLGAVTLPRTSGELPVLFFCSFLGFSLVVDYNKNGVQGNNVIKENFPYYVT